MKISYIESSSNWLDVLNACRATVGKQDATKPPSTKFKQNLLLAEHSPIRLLTIEWEWVNLPYWVAMHFRTHNIGITHLISTQRSDRTGKKRGSQDAPVTHRCVANAQALINISRKRLCNKASLETRQAWYLLLDELMIYEPELTNICVPECVYRGKCFEMQSCGFDKTADFKTERQLYENLNS